MLVVSTRRWEPPANPAAIPDLNGRLHVIALPRTTKTFAFPDVSVVDGSSPPGDGGYGVGGNPTMRPKWPAVPNPDLTRELIEQIARGRANGSPDSKVELALSPLASAPFDARGTSFTPESKVWIAHVSGVTSAPFPGLQPGAGVIGASPPTYDTVDMLISPEDGSVLILTSKPSSPAKPGTQFRLKPDGIVHLGDTLGFTVEGPIVEGSLTMTVKGGTASPIVNVIAIKDLAAFGLKLDREHVPFLEDVAVQTLSVELKYEVGPGQIATEGHTLQVTRDTGAKPNPPMRIQGPGTAAEYHPQAGETPADAFVRSIAADDWQGTGLTFASRMSTLADVHAKGREGIDLDPATQVRVYEVRGKFPTFLVPAVTSTTDKDEVMSPDHLEIAVREALPVRVVSLKAFPQ
jgi:hypothetical protein